MQILILYITIFNRISVFYKWYFYTNIVFPRWRWYLLIQCTFEHCQNNIFHMSEEFLKNFFDYEVPVPGIKYPAGLDAKSDLKLLLQIATCSHLKQGQDKKNLNKQIFYCKNSGKGCFKIQVLFNKENQFEILDDYTTMQHGKDCRERLRLNAKIIQIYNLMMLKRNQIEKFMIKQGLFDCSPEIILQRISGDTGDYFYCKAVSDMQNKRKLKKRFDNIINITIKKKRDRKMDEQVERRKEDSQVQQELQQDEEYANRELISSFKALSICDQQEIEEIDRQKKPKKPKKKKRIFQDKQNVQVKTVKLNQNEYIEQQDVKNLALKRNSSKCSQKSSKKTSSCRRALQEIDTNKYSRRPFQFLKNDNDLNNDESSPNNVKKSQISIIYKYPNEYQPCNNKQIANQDEIYQQIDQIVFQQPMDDIFQRISNKNLCGHERKQENIWAGSNQSIADGDPLGFGEDRIKYVDMCCTSLQNNVVNKSLEKNSLLELENNEYECVQENQFLRPSSYYPRYNYQIVGKENAKR